MMKTSLHVRPRAALLIGAALVATPAFAQDAQPAPQVVTPPPIMVTPAPAPAAPERIIQMAPSSPVVQATPPRPDPVAQEEATEAAPATAVTPRRVTQARRTTTTANTSPAPATEPAATSAAAPVQSAQPSAPVAPGETTVIDTPPPAANTAATQSSDVPAETADQGGFAWPWLLGGLLLVLAGAAALLLMRRRRDESDYAEETPYADDDRVYAAPLATEREPIAVADPVIAPADPVTADPIASTPLVTPRHEPEVTEAYVEAELAKPATEELAAVADAPAPVANRPWIEFGLRPVRAGTSEEEALVDVELTVGNAGDTPARDVRISTFMLADAEGSEMEPLLTGSHADGDVPPVTIQPGDGTRVDAHLSVPKGELGRVFNPVVVAEARYRLADGSEGRTSAAFRIGRPAPDTGGMGPIGATRPHMVDDVAAELVGTPEHA